MILMILMQQLKRVVIGSLEGIEKAEAVGPDDVWVQQKDKAEIFRMSKNTNWYSNNFIGRLVQKNSDDFTETLSNSGVSIF